MKKRFLLLTFSVFCFFAKTTFSQSLEQCKSLIYYEKYISARELLQKFVAANPSSDEGHYWLGQSIIRQDELTTAKIAEAKKIYQSKLAEEPGKSYPLIIVGIAHIELLEGKIQDARSHFESAISLTEGKNISVLNAIGYANGNPEIKNGDPVYAINKLKQATQVKKFKDPDVWVNLGDAYRKNLDGNGAYASYQSAIALDPKYARAYFRLGSLLQSQGKSQEALFLEQYNSAINADPAYAPVYYTLYNYHYETNVTKSAEYFDKWLAHSDPNPRECYFRASIKYAQGYFNEAINKADECIAAEGSNVYVNLFGLKALAYNRLKDSVNAIKNYEEYFKRQQPDKITAGDYAQYAQLLLKFPGNESQASMLLEKAISMDTLESGKLNYIKTMTSYYDAQKKYKEAADWYKKILGIKKNTTKTDLYNAGYGYYRSKDYMSSTEIFNQYIQKFPDDIFGHYMMAKTNAAIDSTGSQGLAVPHFQKAIEIGEKNPEKEKSRLMEAYKYFIEYYYNVKKDQATAIIYADKAILLDPNDAQLKSNREIIQKNDPKTSGKKPVPGKKPVKGKD